MVSYWIKINNLSNKINTVNLYKQIIFIAMPVHHSIYVKQRIVNLSITGKRQVEIVEILLKEDNVKITRQTVASTINRFHETGSVYPKKGPGKACCWRLEHYEFIDKKMTESDELTSW